MSEGQIQILNEVFDGEVPFIEVSVERRILDGSSIRDFVESFNVPARPSSRAYLVMVTSVEGSFDDVKRWKVLFNGITLTREFKPLLTATSFDKRRSICLFAYDVSAVIGMSGSSLRVIYEGSARITVEVTALISLHRYLDVKSYLNFTLGSSAKNEILLPSMPVPFKASDSVLHLVVESPETSTLSLLAESSKELSKVLGITINKGINYLEIDAPLDANSLKIVSEKQIRPLVLIGVASNLSKPSLEVKAKRVSDGIELTVVNRSTSVLDKIDVSLVKYGTILRTFNIENVDLGKTLKMVLKGHEASEATHVKIHWRAAYRQGFLNVNIES